MTTKCPKCGQSYEVEASSIGQPAQCSKCGETFTISAPSELVLQTPSAPPADNKELMRRARESLSGKWGVCIGASFIFQAIMSVVQFIPGLGNFAGLIISGPFALGMAILFLSVARKNQTTIGQIFEGFNNFVTALVANLLMALFIILWSLLLVIPGIIATYSYAMTFFIIADNPGIKASEAIKRSKAMMMGRKWKLFCLLFRFFGWALLCILTCGIGFFWLVPYMQTSIAHFYEDAKAATNFTDGFAS